MMQIVRGGRLFFSKQSAAPAAWFGEARNIVWRGRSYAASLSSDSPKRKKVAKDERRALIESFVTRYRSENAGKFPNATAAKKEVGGSYYVVRKVLQELQYKSEICSANSSYENLSAKVVNKEDKSYSAVEVVSTAAEVVSTAAGVRGDTFTETMDYKQLEADKVYTSAEKTFSEGVLKPQTPDSNCGFVLEENSVLKGDVKLLEKQEYDKVEDAGIDSSDKFPAFLDKQKIVEASDQHIESEECKTESQGVQPGFGVIEGDLLKEETEVGNEEGEEKEQTVSKELLNSGTPELKTEHHEQFWEEEKFARNLLREQNDETESSKKSSLWANLKSFADGIINRWRNL